ncbi:PREDICTED: putative OPA3-like protein CG13603 [Acromyrmex echinatior]|uniref:Putative OPA3-like protein n=1 Tax=Acromyrmex echinatior TaxID=103372 RepID=F4WDL8_ACREC|nr:PREDICTED: putative OPA3-like protein CG13603 [Acromyrmex echinatior]XP_011050874.1 PREDICTED: putative OPA3-like protein CG13603 [Acromyrmex echinatior]EGI67798.1 Putative OPA3-like protein [Acromyrmex echinatior]
MPVGVFPALKLGVLFIKQISKPLAKFLVNQAKTRPIFRTYFIIPPAQFYHWAEVKAKMYIMNLGKPTKVAKLNEAMAIELGASLIGELIIFSVAGGCVILEYNRQVTKETKKEEIRQMQIQKFTDDVQELYNISLQQEARIHYLQNAIHELANHMKHKLPELVSRPINNSSNNLDDDMKKNCNRNSKNSTEANPESENTSLIERAIVYYNKELKGDKLS